MGKEGHIGEFWGGILQCATVLKIKENKNFKNINLKPKPVSVLMIF